MYPKTTSKTYNLKLSMGPGMTSLWLCDRRRECTTVLTLTNSMEERF